MKKESILDEGTHSTQYWLDETIPSGISFHYFILQTLM